MLNTLSVLMVGVLCLNSAYAAKAEAIDASSQRQPASQGSAIQQQLTLIPAGSVVEVRLTNNEKLKGQLGGVSGEGIVLKYAKTSQVEERKIAFSEMKSIKAVKGRRTALWILVGIGVAIGVVLVADAAVGET
jgi:hypothetical protein